MITMDNTVVANALPTIMADLHMSATAKDWVATGYILMFSCLMIAGGRLTDVYGCRITFVSGMTLFTAASAACGLAPDATVLILARVAQGAGAALALPATQVMVTVGRSDKQRSIGMIVWVGAGSAATALGPTIGGLIVQHWHWGWIFLINIVPGVLVILLGLVVLTGHGENADARVDLPGVLISATLLFAFIYGLEEGRTVGWTDPSVLSVFGLVLIALVCFVAVESWAPDPMIDLRFLRNRVFTGGLLSQMLYGIGFNGMIFYSATFLQRYLGFTPPEAGLVMLPPSIAIMVLTPVGFWLAAKAGPRGAIGGGMALMAFGMFLFATLRRGDGYAELMPGVMIVGAGAALAMPLVMYVLKAIPEHQAGVASGIINVIREASGAFGIAIVGLLVHEVPEPGASAESLETFRQGTASGLIVGAAAVLIGGVICGLTLPSRRGWLGPKHGKRSTPVEAAPAPEPALAAPVPTGQTSAHHADTTGAAHPQATLTRRKAAPPAAQPHAPAPRRPAPPEHLPQPHHAARRASPRYGLRDHDTKPTHDTIPPSVPKAAHPWDTHPVHKPPSAPEAPRDVAQHPTERRPPREAPPLGDTMPPHAEMPAHGAPPGDAAARTRQAMPSNGSGPHRDVAHPGGAPRSETAASGEATSRSPFPPPPEGWYHPYIPEDDTDPWGEWEVPRRGDAW
jgi:EmrB/QacA subfamily drug resistance transporter